MKSRAINSVRNTSYAIISQIVVSLLMFITRTIFVKVLSSMYLGLSGLFGDILTLLSLAELGVGTAITYSMYKPVAENDKEKISAMKSHYEKGGLGDVKVKKYLNEVLQDILEPIRERRKLLEQNISEVYKIAFEGTEKAKIVTNETLEKVKKSMKIDYKDFFTK